MNAIICGLAALCIGGAVSASRAGDVYVVDNARGNRPLVTQKDGFTRNPVPVTNGGQNQGYSSAMMFATPATGVTVYAGHMDPGGKIAHHEGGTVYVRYVVRGTGKLINLDPAGATTSEIAYKPDDVIVFQPNTHHRWENGSEAFDFIGVSQPQPKP
jgi:mannose-6-phosphate isomerase-like protein (cupin superfamily)